MNTKALKRFTALFMALVVSLSLFGCGNATTSVIDSGNINSTEYADSMYWENSQELNLVTNVTTKVDVLDSPFQDDNYSQLSFLQKKKVEKLKDAIHSYFVDNYDIDFSDQLSQQKVTYFTSSEAGISMVMGYVDPSDHNTLHLNSVLNTSEYSQLFENTYVHETLHQLGFIDETHRTTYIIEGITDAYTDLILTAAHRFSYPTPIYMEARQLGYQLIAADKNLPSIFVGNCSENELENMPTFEKYINTSLAQYEQKYEKHKNLAVYLNRLLFCLIYINNGTAYSENADFYAYDAQSIVQKFCQSQDCSAETIAYIRSHYVFSDFESVKITPQDGGYFLS